jgi:hypothetical protein
VPYLAVSDFKFGLDRRRPQTVGIPGTLWNLKNAFISRGGDIVRAKLWEDTYTLPADTFGLYALKGQLFVFGSEAAPTMPTGVRYQQLVGAGGGDMAEIVDVRAFDGKLYVIARFVGGNVYHYYDGTRVDDWDQIGVDSSTIELVAEYLAAKVNESEDVSAFANGAAVIITAETPGTAFTISTGVDDVDTVTNPTADATQVQPNTPAVAEVQATGTIEVNSGTSGANNTISSVTVNAVELLGSAVSWIASNDATANALVVAINNRTSTHTYTAEAAANLVTITAQAGTGSDPNGYTVASTTTGNVVTSTTNMAGGVDEVEPVAQVYEVLLGNDTFDGVDQWSITINGEEFESAGRTPGTGSFAYVTKHRVWSVASSLLRYCVLDDATDWETIAVPSSDAGFINVSQESEGSQALLALASYNGSTAIFARENIIIYTLSANAEENVILNTLENTGTFAPHSVVPFGNTDVFYLHDTGVRSIRSREGTNAAYVSDVGSAIDPFIQDIIADVGEAAASKSKAIIDPRDGRYLLGIGNYILALSYFPEVKITAWSYLDQGYSIDNIVRSGRDMYLRSGDTIYRYGGADGNTYPDDDEFVAVAETPFMDARDPAARKMLEGFDMALSGEWLVDVLVDPNDTSRYVRVGILNKTSYHLPKIPLPGLTSHFAFRFTCSRGGFASISSMAIHYEEEETG